MSYINLINHYEQIVRLSLHTNFNTIYDQYLYSNQLDIIIDILLQFMANNWYAYNTQAFYFLKRIIMEGLCDADKLIHQYLNKIYTITHQEHIGLLMDESIFDLSDEYIDKMLKQHDNQFLEMINQYDIEKSYMIISNRKYFIKLIKTFKHKRLQYKKSSFNLLKQQFGDIAHIINSYL